VTECPDDNTLAGLADGALGDAERADLEAHLDDCLACGQILSELGAMVVALPSPPGYRVLAEAEWGGWLALAADGRKVWLYRPGKSVDRGRALRDARSLADVPLAGHGAVVEVVPGDEATNAAIDAAIDDAMIVASLPNGAPIHRWGAPPRARTEVVAMWRSAIAAVSALHERGAVHQGLTPERIRAHEGGVEIVGLAAPVTELAYQAPELRRGQPGSARADQFALCTAMWEGLTGRRPYAGATSGALAVTMQAPLELPAEDRAWFAALRRGLDPDPQKRWPDLAALEQALSRRDARARRSPVVPWAILAAALVIAGALGWWLAR
jgi:hypothetical protein